ncbi:plasmid pRiA4b ORF-3 family protein [Sphingopyxis sp. 22461]|uniref:plasmid pRiA4b ORF-3 family protein n=1 Tax=Sphingopyxis sp. 22461 TaxID=3453923 RepID=UPI003F8523CA
MTLIARLKIVLRDIEPKVMRRIEVPLSINLDRLHTVIQIAMGWTDTHLYEFRFAGDAAFGIPDPDYLSSMNDARKTTLRSAIDDCGGKTFRYIYDFGDYWDHAVTVERIEARVPGFPYPSLLAATGRCPPEDVGGSPGYAEYLEALADPDHPEHEDMLEWGGDFDPDKIDIADIAIRLTDIGLAWERKPHRKAHATPKS